MLSRAPHIIGWLFALTALVGTSGCVERRMVVITEPYGAIVYDEKEQAIGASPVDKPFTYYGKYRFRLAKDGYETMVVEQKVGAPWYEWPGLDFVAENLIPWTIRDVRTYRYVMNPAQVKSPEQLLLEGGMLREYGRTIGEPMPDFVTPPPGQPTTLLPPER